jgi:hypothetical protein
MIRPIPAIAVLTALAACAPSAPNTIVPEPSAKPYVGGPLIIGMKGIGPIRAMTYFEPPRIRDLFPRARITTGVIQIDPLDPKDTLDDIVVYDGDTPMLEIDDGTRSAPGTDDPLIGQVRAVGGPVVGPHGVKLGLRWRDARFDLSQCEIGEKHQRGALVCARPLEGAVAYIFAVPGWDAVDLPKPWQLWNHAYLREMVWTPHTTRGPS